MLKFVVVFCAVTVCALSAPTAPTEKPGENNSADSNLHEKLILEKHQVSGISIQSQSPSTENREKREDLPSSSTDNKRTPALSQPDYQENKPPTFVHPVPVDQIVRNSEASPQIHSSKHAGGVEEKVDKESESEVVNKEEEAEEHGHNKQPINYKTNTDSADNKSREDN